MNKQNIFGKVLPKNKMKGISNTKSANITEKNKWIRSNRWKLLYRTTSTEEKLYEVLDILKVEYVKQMPITVDSKIYFADAYIPQSHAIIEMDGLYHFEKGQKKKDRIRNSVLHKYGYSIFHYKNELLEDLPSFIDNINKELELNISAYKYV